MRLVSKFVGLAAMAVVGLLPSSASADPYTFTFDSCVSNNWSGCGTDSFLSKLQVEVTQTDAGYVDFKFTNTYVAPDGTTPSITALYFDLGDTLFTDIAVLSESAGVDFTAGNPTPPDLPAANGADPDFEVTKITTGHGSNKKTVTLGADTQGSPTGIDSPTESVTLRLTLATGVDFADIISAIEDGPGVDSLRIAAHIQSLPGGLSDSVICCGSGDGTPSPEPASMSLFGLITLGAAYRMRRRKSVE